MTRRLLPLLGLVFLVGTLSQIANAADDTYADAIAKMTKAERDAVTTTETALKKLEAAVTSKKQALGTYEGERDKTVSPYNESLQALEKAKKSHDEWTKYHTAVGSKTKGGFFGIGASPDVDNQELTRAAKEVAIAAEKYEQAQKLFNTAETNWNAADKQVKGAQGEVDEALKKQKAQADSLAAAQRLAEKKAAKAQLDIQNLESEIQKAKAGDQMDKLYAKTQDAQLNQLVLENTWNKGLIGNFVKAKMEGLLSEDAFCEGIKSCPSKAGEKSKFKANLDHLFTTTANARTKEKGGEGDGSTHKAPGN